MSKNHLYYGDNLDILRNETSDESVDLIYLDPPFNSRATYNVLFHSPEGHKSTAQIEAFEDTWHWTHEAEDAFDEVISSGNAYAAEVLRALRAFLGENDMMAYLAIMAVRLLELHRILKPTGSIYLHCDSTASHYLKVLMDSVFGTQMFRNEIIWRRSHAHSDARQGSKHFGRVTDTLLFYSKTDETTWNVQYQPYDQSYIDRDYRRTDENGRRYRLDNIQGPGGAEKGNPMYDVMGVSRYWRYSKERMQELIEQGRIVQTRPGTVPQYKRYLDEMLGVPLQNIWTDMPGINNRSNEYLGYPTQKPVSLLERILNTSSNEGDLVLDPFCGCGTTIHAAQKLKRHWVGIDITHLAISLIEKRLNDTFPGIEYEVHGTPKDIDGAKALAAANKYQFQWWAVSLVNAVPYGGKKKGADTGIDGLIYFKPDGKKTERAIVSVKGGGHVGVAMIRDLGHVVAREKAKIGVFITLANPTKPMVTESVKAGSYDTGYGKYPRIQILTIAELFQGSKPDIPLVDPTAFKKAAVEEQEQKKLF